MRAREADEQGYIERDGVRVQYEVFGTGEPTYLFCPTWTLIPSAVWKMQVPYFARHGRVITFDPRGNGGSDRPQRTAAYAEREFTQDAIDILDATGTERAVVIGLSKGGQRALLTAADHPDRVSALVLIAPLWPASFAPVSVLTRAVARTPFLFERPGIPISYGRMNGHYWRRHFADFVRWFCEMCIREPHSSKGLEDAVAWGLGCDAETLVRSWQADAAAPLTRRDQLDLARRVRCPTLVISGTDDRVTPHADAALLAKTTGGRLVAVPGGDHVPELRHPVETNLAIRELADPTFRRNPALSRNGAPRALFVSSPIGLGHARRDVAIARELRTLVPDLQIDWLAQDPVTRVLADAGEQVHPASAGLANESAHFQREASGHDLHCFEALRRMDEILTANYMVFDDVVRETHYDLWIGDEAWELDHHLHENPERKRAPFAWLTDFVGYVPLPENGAREAELTADYNAEMVEHVRDHPHIRDAAIFVGDPEDVVPGRLGPDLPGIREWTEQHFSFSGYILGGEAEHDREEVRAELGWAPDERVCVVTVGGSGVGTPLLRRIVEALPAARERVPDLRMLAVTGPRIDPASLPATEGLEVHGYVRDLDRLLAACDIAVVHGGLATTMELTAAGRAFLYFPLGRHFEQQIHVAHRLRRHRAGRRMDAATATPETIAAALAEELARVPEHVPVRDGGARRAAERIAALL